MTRERMTQEKARKLRDLWVGNEFKNTLLIDLRRFVVGLLDEILLRDAEIERLGKQVEYFRDMAASS